MNTEERFEECWYILNNVTGFKRMPYSYFWNREQKKVVRSQKHHDITTHNLVTLSLVQFYGMEEKRL